MKEIACKWCGRTTRMLGTKECDRCWELRHRIEGDRELAKKMFREIFKAEICGA